jgi:hypothetical protein
MALVRRYTSGGLEGQLERARERGSIKHYSRDGHRWLIKLDDREWFSTETKRGVVVFLLRMRREERRPDKLKQR